MGSGIAFALASIVAIFVAVASAESSIEIRGAVASVVDGQSNLVNNSFTWNPQNFAGFFYDIKNDLGTENLKFVLSGNDGKNLSGEEPSGVTYTSTAQNTSYEQKLWGTYKVIGFLNGKYFAGYNPSANDSSNLFYAQSTDKNSLAGKQLEKILMDSKDEMIITSGKPLKLGEGYELAIKSIDVSGNIVFVELSKDGVTIDSKVVSPSKDSASELDKTYYYKNPKVGDQKRLVTIGVHFKNAFRGAEQNQATIDGVWQISDAPIEVKADTQYEKMIITGIDATTGVITMNNKDEPITLTKNKDTVLMPGVNIKTADNDTLRFYIYEPVTVEGPAQAPEAAYENVTAEPPPVIKLGKTDETKKVQPGASETVTQPAAQETVGQPVAPETVAQLPAKKAVTQPAAPETVAQLPAKKAVTQPVAPETVAQLPAKKAVTQPAEPAKYAATPESSGSSDGGLLISKPPVGPAKYAATAETVKAADKSKTAASKPAAEAAVKAAIENVTAAAAGAADEKPSGGVNLKDFVDQINSLKALNLRGKLGLIACAFIVLISTAYRGREPPIEDDDLEDISGFGNTKEIK